jgi:hypothetical protein
MKSQWGLAVAMLASMGFGVPTVEYLHAPSKPLIYRVGRIETAEPECYAKQYPTIAGKMSCFSVRVLLSS